MKPLMPRRPDRRLPHLLLAVLGATLAFAAPAGAATAPTRPAVKTGTAGTITYQAANLTGTVNPGGAPTTYFFQYGPTAAYGGQSLPVSIAAGIRTVGVKTPIAGLVPRTRYHYRLVAINAAGTGLGADATLTTAPIPLSLSIVALPSPAVFGAPVGVLGTLTGTGAAGRAVILQQNPYPFTAGFQNAGNPELTTATGGFQFNVISLPSTTQFRVVSIGPGQPVVSAILTEYVQLAVTMRVTRHNTHRGYYDVRFSGAISPAENGSRVSVQRLIGSQWRFVRGTTARPASAGSSSYAQTLHLRRGGFYRVYVSPVEGGHVANFATPMLVHAGGRP